MIASTADMSLINQIRTHFLCKAIQYYMYFFNGHETMSVFIELIDRQPAPFNGVLSFVRNHKQSLESGIALRIDEGILSWRKHAFLSFFLSSIERDPYRV